MRSFERSQHETLILIAGMGASSFQLGNNQPKLASQTRIPESGIWVKQYQLKGLILAQNERWRRGLGMQVERA